MLSAAMFTNWTPALRQYSASAASMQNMPAHLSVRRVFSITEWMTWRVIAPEIQNDVLDDYAVSIGWLNDPELLVERQG